jgi:hypothetical protein
VLKYSAGDKTRLAAVSIVRIPRKPGVDEIMFRTRCPVGLRIFSQEKSQDGKTKKPWHVQDKSCGEETREGRPVF